ncbi:MAG TPA: OadG family protein [Megamonas hypermegale]|jgi:glutaconyl-CoA decarboxylase|uniref:Oxaloacetate decarboxylase, gamma chain n=1 Tax=Megamonas hypermegale TaxID=158847 RepID=A0A239TDI5_9FIRM|nr:OadG family protein [Megamonas hypermegale]MBM6760416.1 OadG family protein [Megamonas hypermegale]SNU94984.1 Oxaloacetate decarboxylase, gamma chain [Megamonas hypermegale]HJG08040.1 OadG family protein [Megamonas hypermegale]
MDAPNPILITVINMVIVFAVLYVLGLLIKFIHYIDPTKSKSKKPVKVGKVITKKPKPVKPVQSAADVIAEKTLIAVITTSLMAYGCRDFEIKSIKKL